MEIGLGKLIIPLTKVPLAKLVELSRAKGFTVKNAVQQQSDDWETIFNCDLIAQCPPLDKLENLEYFNQQLNQLQKILE